MKVIRCQRSPLKYAWQNSHMDIEHEALDMDMHVDMGMDTITDLGTDTDMGYGHVQDKQTVSHFVSQDKQRIRN